MVPGAPLRRCVSLRVGRRHVLAASAAAFLPAAAAIDGFAFTPRRLEASRHAFGGPATGGGRLRIVQVSDLHIRSFGGFERRVLDAIAAARPDVIVHTGDMLESPRGCSPLREFFESCPAVPSFAIPGNWEYSSGVPMREFERLCGRFGIEWLVDRSVVFQHAATAVRITGLDDLRGGRPDPAVAVHGGEAVPNHLVLAHCPALRDRLALSPPHAVDLVLSGHTHGGQIAPFDMALVLPPGSGGYVAGWYGRGGGAALPPLYVSRGVGTSLLPVRIGATPELAVFEWDLA